MMSVEPRNSVVRLLINRLPVALRSRVRQGRTRVRAGFWPIVEAALAASLAFWIAGQLLGHAAPFFAPVCAWVCLGFTSDRSPRRVAEVGIGVTIGVGLGEVIAQLIGTGPLQIGLVLAVAALVARFLDRGALLTTQAGVQAIVIVGLPVASSAAGVGRWTDALVGAGVALVAASITPGDPRSRPRRLGGEAISELARTFEDIARGMRSGDPAERAAALARGRASEPALDEWQSAARDSLATAKVTANGRKHRGELAGMVRTATMGDRTMRTVRVIARRATDLGTGPEVNHLAGLLDDLGKTSYELAEDLAGGADPATVRQALADVAGRLDPGSLGSGEWQVQSLILILRSAVVDLSETAGATPEEARQALAEM